MRRAGWRAEFQHVSGPNPYGLPLSNMDMFPKYRSIATKIYGVLTRVRPANCYAQRPRLRTPDTPTCSKRCPDRMHTRDSS